MIITSESFTIFQSGQNNGVEIWAFGATQGHFQIKLTLILILQFSEMFQL